MIKLLEIIFRRFILILLMLLIPIIIGVGISYLLPRSYQASSALWALQRFQVIGATGPESNLQATPADTQTSALIELLQTRAFDIAVGETSDLKSTFSAQDRADPQALADAYVAEVSKNVQVVTNGTNSYQINYTNKDSRIAFQVLKAVVAQFQAQGQRFSVVQGQLLLGEDQAQLVQIQNDANTAAGIESNYQAKHPGATITDDPQYALLDAQRIQAQNTLQNIQTTIATLKQDIASQSAGGGAFFKVLDSPVQPNKAVSRSKVLLTTGGIGAAVGLLVCILYILIIMRRDHALYTVFDLEKVTSYPILMQLPQLPNKKKEIVSRGRSK